MIKYFQVFFKKPKKTYNTRMFESNWAYVTTMHLTICWPQILWMYHVSFNYLLTLNFVNVPYVNKTLIKCPIYTNVT
jgi:hypothetical protein